MNYVEQQIIYEIAPDGSYCGGYSFNANDQDRYLGGNSNDRSQYENKIIPIGLFYKKPNKDEDNLRDNHYIDGGLINDQMFNNLLFSVGEMKNPYVKSQSSSKTRKHSKK
jgi:hypothetical protein